MIWNDHMKYLLFLQVFCGKRRVQMSHSIVQLGWSSPKDWLLRMWKNLWKYLLVGCYNMKMYWAATKFWIALVIKAVLLAFVKMSCRRSVHFYWEAAWPNKLSLFWHLCHVAMIWPTCEQAACHPNRWAWMQLAKDIFILCAADVHAY